MTEKLPALFRDVIGKTSQGSVHNLGFEWSGAGITLPVNDIPMNTGHILIVRSPFTPVWLFRLQGKNMPYPLNSRLT